jgi:hypothetical protein
MAVSAQHRRLLDEIGGETFNESSLQALGVQPARCQLDFQRGDCQRCNAIYCQLRHGNALAQRAAVTVEQKNDADGRNLHQARPSRDVATGFVFAYRGGGAWSIARSLGTQLVAMASTELSHSAGDRVVLPLPGSKWDLEVDVDLLVQLEAEFGALRGGGAFAREHFV